MGPRSPEPASQRSKSSETAIPFDNKPSSGRRSNDSLDVQSCELEPDSGMNYPSMLSGMPSKSAHVLPDHPWRGRPPVVQRRRAQKPKNKTEKPPGLPIRPPVGLRRLHETYPKLYHERVTAKDAVSLSKSISSSGVQTLTVKDGKSFPFFSLPKEVRLMIYDEVLLLQDPIEFCPHGSSGQGKMEKREGLRRLEAISKYEHEIVPRLKLLRTCKLIHFEAAYIFYRGNTFQFSSSFGWIMLFAFLCAIGERKVAMLRNINICAPWCADKAPTLVSITSRHNVVYLLKKFGLYSSAVEKKPRFAGHYCADYVMAESCRWLERLKSLHNLRLLMPITTVDDNAAKDNSSDDSKFEAAVRKSCLLPGFRMESYWAHWVLIERLKRRNQALNVTLDVSDFYDQEGVVRRDEVLARLVKQARIFGWSVDG
jgi:hypothetical protein